jgi:hypothetical protein
MLAITEDAVEQLVTTLGRHRSSHGTAADRAACWLRLVSITEIYAETLLGHLDGANPGGCRVAGTTCDRPWPRTFHGQAAQEARCDAGIVVQGDARDRRGRPGRLGRDHR